jgi:hypothetical protein
MPALHSYEIASLVPRPALAPLRATIGGFSRYSDALQALPPGERRKILSIARFVVSRLRHGQNRISGIRLRGHADKDTPRRPSFEMQMSLARARRVRNALSWAIDRIAASLPGPAPLPLFSSRINWRISGAGALRPIVPNARSEPNRARNRRVEILLYQKPVSVARSTKFFAMVGQTQDSDRIDTIIQEFLNRIGEANIDRKNCFAAGTQVIQLLAPGAPQNITCGMQLGGHLATSKDYRAPFSKTVKCCQWNADCSRSPYQTGCGHCSSATGPYLILNYDAGLLARAVARVKCTLDQGCVVRAGVLSGICDDKPDLGCAKSTAAGEVWRTCPEHWLVILGYVGDAFVFWDSARTSRIAKGAHEFGLLHYNPTENRLTTGADLSKMDVDSSGFHTWSPKQKRYQVLRLQTGGRYKPATGSC